MEQPTDRPDTDKRLAPTPFETWTGGVLHGLLVAAVGITPQDCTEADLREAFTAFLLEWVHESGHFGTPPVPPVPPSPAVRGDGPGIEELPEWAALVAAVDDNPGLMWIGDRAIDLVRAAVGLAAAPPATSDERICTFCAHGEGHHGNPGARCGGAFATSGVCLCREFVPPATSPEPDEPTVAIDEAAAAQIVTLAGYATVAAHGYPEAKGIKRATDAVLPLVAPLVTDNYLDTWNLTRPAPATTDQTDDPAFYEADPFGGPPTPRFDPRQSSTPDEPARPPVTGEPR